MPTIYWGISHLYISEAGRDRIRFGLDLMQQPYDAGEGITITLADDAQIPPELRARVRAWADQEWEDLDAAAYVYDSGMFWLAVTGPHPPEILRERLDAFLLRAIGLVTEIELDE
jgi:hypothetical protein